MSGAIEGSPATPRERMPASRTRKSDTACCHVLARHRNSPAIGESNSVETTLCDRLPVSQVCSMSAPHPSINTSIHTPLWMAELRHRPRSKPPGNVMPNLWLSSFIGSVTSYGIGCESMGPARANHARRAHADRGRRCALMRRPRSFLVPRALAKVAGASVGLSTRCPFKGCADNRRTFGRVAQGGFKHGVSCPDEAQKVCFTRRPIDWPWRRRFPAGCESAAPTYLDRVFRDARGPHDRTRYQLGEVAATQRAKGTWPWFLRGRIAMAGLSGPVYARQLTGCLSGSRLRGEAGRCLESTARTQRIRLAPPSSWATIWRLRPPDACMADAR